MERFISHFSAARHWNIPYIEAVLNPVNSEAETVDYVDYTVLNASKRYRKKGCNIYLCQRQLPPRAVKLKDGIMVASPELVFLQLASKLSIQRLILLGLQLCSYPPGLPAKSISTKRKLKAFPDKTKGFKGHSNASRAVKYIENGSASIMESITYMILTLPHALGGYGLKGAVFNYEIKLKEDAAKRLRQNRCFLDLYYESKKLAVEYDSFAFHGSPSEQGKDAIRAEILKNHGVDVMQLSTIQIYDREACSDFAANLAHRLGKRIDIRTNKFIEMNAHLRSLLPTADKDHA
jgi:hypothetical protein